MATDTFDAPWGGSLKLITALCVVILVGIALIGLFTGPEDNRYWFLGMVVTPLLVLLLGSLFTIRGYVLGKDQLLIRRPGWNTRLDLDGLQSAEVDNLAVMGSLRTFGNGGLFCFAGWFRNRRLGTYRMFATDPSRAVVLRFSQRTVVVTPGDPDNFVKQLQRLRDL